MFVSTIQLALSSWSLHSDLLNWPETRGVAFRFLNIARNHFRVRHIEFFESDYWPGGVLDRYCTDHHAGDVKARCEKLGLNVVCIAAENDFSVNNEEELEKDFNRLLKWVRHCQILGCPVIRINTGRHLRVLTTKEGKVVTQRFAENVKELLRRIDTEYGKSEPITLAIENHPHLLQTVEDAKLLIDMIGSINKEIKPDDSEEVPKRVQILLDIGAIQKENRSAIVKELIDHTAHIHLKSVIENEDGSGPMEFAQTEETDGTVKSGYGRGFREAIGSFSASVSVEFTEFRQFFREDGWDKISDLLKAVCGEFGCTLHTDTVGAYFNPVHAGRQGEVILADHSGSLGYVPPWSAIKAMIQPCANTLQQPITVREFFRRGIPDKSIALDDQSKTHVAVVLHDKPLVDVEKTAEAVGPTTGPQVSPASEYCSLCPLCQKLQTLEVEGQEWVDAPLTECRNFHQEKIKRTMEGKQREARLCICPFGMVLASAPIVDYDNGKWVLFGSITTGIWVEPSTGGMGVDAIARFVDKDYQEEFNQLWEEIPRRNKSQLLGFVRILQKYARELSDIYRQSQLVKRINQTNDEISDNLLEIRRKLKTYLESLHKISADEADSDVDDSASQPKTDELNGLKQVGGIITEALKKLREPVLHGPLITNPHRLGKLLDDQKQLYEQEIPPELFQFDVEPDLADLPPLETQEEIVQYILGPCLMPELAAHLGMENEVTPAKLEVKGFECDKSLAEDWISSLQGQRLTVRLENVPGHAKFLDRYIDRVGNLIELAGGTITRSADDQVSFDFEYRIPVFILNNVTSDFPNLRDRVEAIRGISRCDCFSALDVFNREAFPPITESADQSTPPRVLVALNPYVQESETSATIDTQALPLGIALIQRLQELNVKLFVLQEHADTRLIGDKLATEVAVAKDRVFWTNFDPGAHSNLESFLVQLEVEARKLAGGKSP